MKRIVSHVRHRISVHPSLDPVPYLEDVGLADGVYEVLIDLSVERLAPDSVEPVMLDAVPFPDLSAFPDRSEGHWDEALQRQYDFLER